MSEQKRTSADWTLILSKLYEPAKGTDETTSMFLLAAALSEGDQARARARQRELLASIEKRGGRQAVADLVNRIATREGIPFNEALHVAAGERPLGK